MKGKFTQAGRIDRRTLLKVAGGAAGGGLAVTAVGSARRGNGGGSGGGKSGGRGQTSDPVHLREPFTVSDPKTVRRRASCMSENSAWQEYLQYTYEYCNSDLEGGTFCVIPDDSKLDEDRVYEFRSAQDCKGDHSFSTKFSFGPSNSRDSC
jgi:hypothetical protein